MKKIILSIMIVLFTSTITSYSQIFKEKETSAAETSPENQKTDNSSNGFFRADPPGPGDRPGPGEGIGQEAPVGDGFHILITCCLVFGLVKLYSVRQKNK